MSAKALAYSGKSANLAARVLALLPGLFARVRRAQRDDRATRDMHVTSPTEAPRLLQEWYTSPGGQFSSTACRTVF